jgi:ubiquinone biosynthesis protein COQ4
MRKIWTNLRFLTAFIRAVRDPNRTDEIFKLSADPNVMAGEDHQALLEMISKVPHSREALQRKKLAQWSAESFAKLPENTFGFQYFKRLKENDLQEKFYPDLDINRDIDFVRLWLRQTHDIVHVLTGFDTSIEDEAGLQAFYFAQLKPRLSALIIAVAILHNLLYRSNYLPKLFERIVTGWQLGKDATPLFGERFEEHWSEDLEIYRRHLGLQGPGTITNPTGD